MKSPAIALKALLALAIGSSLVACAPSAPQLKKVMEENPDILYSVIKKDPKKFLDVVNEAAQAARAGEEQRYVEEEGKRREEEFKNPKKPEIAADRAFEGAKDAPITIVEYSDFQCPFCKRGASTMKEVLDAYPGKVKVLFKNFPIERIHPLARPASEWYEAIALQSTDKASKFKHMIFENQDTMNDKGEKYFAEAAKKVGADVAKAKADLKSEAVQKRLEADRTEAEKFGFSGTPGYLVNGVSLKGAYPLDDFKEVIDRQLAGK
ncbi:MAG TPA: thioredoxin domain-containing protein [Bdellovibrionales bacterium]|nr:thioredoxin domain-containing protein [Bdellovibrionales bacterium]